LELQGLLQLFNLSGVLADELDHVRHGEVNHLALSSQLQKRFSKISLIGVGRTGSEHLGIDRIAGSPFEGERQG
jgi:hypothetical protein